MAKAKKTKAVAKPKGPSAGEELDAAIAVAEKKVSRMQVKVGRATKKLVDAQNELGMMRRWKDKLK